MGIPLKYYIVTIQTDPQSKRVTGRTIVGYEMTVTNATFGIKSVGVTGYETVVAVCCHSEIEAESLAYIEFNRAHEPQSPINQEEDMNNQQSPDTERKMKIILLEAALQAMVDTYQDQCRSYTNQGIRYVDEYALWLTTSRDLVKEIQDRLSALKNPVDAKPC